ncbi:MAG: hypothetical protein HRU20_19235 [Pseudomonadales bacterium]|nr:hypothetical protein [Pseudomonadales bacterium]
MQRLVKYSALTGFVLLMLSACGVHAVEEDVAEDENLARCSDPRPQMCTMDYTPVCGVTADGQKKTYGNACGACADVAVLSYQEGVCPE